MHILLGASSVLRFENKFLQSLFRGFIPMDSVICLEHLSSLYYHLGFGFFALGNFKEMSEIFGLFLLVAFGFKSLYSLCFPTRYSSQTSREKPRKSKNAEIVVDAKLDRKLDEKNDSELEIEGKCGSDLRKLMRMERRRANEARAEVERERAACGTAVEEAMGMIQRLQCEKSWMEMEFNQHRRLCEAKRVHDEEVIQSLVQTYEAELTILRQHLGMFQKPSIPNFSP